MFVPKMILSERTKLKHGSTVQGRNGEVYECVHYDSKDTLLESFSTGKTKTVKTMTMDKYFERVARPIDIYLEVEETGSYYRVNNGTLECTTINEDGSIGGEWSEVEDFYPIVVEKANSFFKTNFIANVEDN
ncbi:MAG: hypothetical protein GQ474_00565 [Sulfurimonas sp.]|nr:hypothetical protein [Sulfurimonas sp.]